MPPFRSTTIHRTSHLFRSNHITKNVFVCICNERKKNTDKTNVHTARVDSIIECALLLLLWPLDGWHTIVSLVCDTTQLHYACTAFINTCHPILQTDTPYSCCGLLTAQLCIRNIIGSWMHYYVHVYDTHTHTHTRIYIVRVVHRESTPATGQMVVNFYIIYSAHNIYNMYKYICHAYITDTHIIWMMLKVRMPF